MWRVRHEILQGIVSNILGSMMHTWQFASADIITTSSSPGQNIAYPSLEYFATLCTYLALRSDRPTLRSFSSEIRSKRSAVTSLSGT